MRKKGRKKGKESVGGRMQDEGEGERKGRMRIE